MRTLISSINVGGRFSERGNVFGNWACTLSPEGVPAWGFFTSGASRLPVRATAFRNQTAYLFSVHEDLITHPSVIADPRGGSRPPRSAASALREQARKRRYNAARRSRRVDAAPTLFG